MRGHIHPYTHTYTSTYASTYSELYAYTCIYFYIRAHVFSAPCLARQQRTNPKINTQRNVICDDNSSTNKRNNISSIVS